jgi:hypothetical protein
MKSDFKIKVELRETTHTEEEVNIDRPSHLDSIRDLEGPRIVSWPDDKDFIKSERLMRESNWRWLSAQLPQRM